MPSARAGIDVEDLEPGTGAEATREHEAHVEYKLFLHRGECVQEAKDTPGGYQYWIDLRRRNAIAGLRYGLEGMRVGGLRRIVVPPHLGYGGHSVPGVVPANAILIFEVRLLGLRPSRPSDCKMEPFT